jgi:hypothetical protein
MPLFRWQMLQIKTNPSQHSAFTNLILPDAIAAAASSALTSTSPPSSLPSTHSRTADSPTCFDPALLFISMSTLSSFSLTSTAIAAPSSP